MLHSQLSALNNDKALKLIIPSLSQVQVNEVMKLRKGEDKFLKVFNLLLTEKQLSAMKKPSK